MINISELTAVNSNFEVRISDVAFGSGAIKLTGMLLCPDTGGIVPGAILCHGFGTSSRTVEAPARMLASKGIAVLIFDFRGHGKSDGIVDDNIVADVIDAWNFLSGHPNVDSNRMALAGHSLGAMAAILAAHKVKPRALIALSCPPEINGDITRLSFEVPDGIQEYDAVMEYPRDGSLPWVRGFFGSMVSCLWMHIAGYKVRVDWSKFFRAFSKARLSSVVRELKDCAMLFVHCGGDSISPYTTAMALYEIASGPKEILITDGGFHSTPLLAGRVRRSWTDWTASTLRSM